MKLIKNIKDGEFGKEAEVYFSLYERYISMIDEGDDINYVQLCVENLNNLSESLIISLCEASIRYCNDFLDAVGEETKDFNDVKEVLEMIYPSMLVVPEQEYQNEPVIHLELNCDWEEEHGMEWIIRNNQLLYVGAFNGEDPWGDYTQKGTWNFA